MDEEKLIVTVVIASAVHFLLFIDKQQQRNAIGDIAAVSALTEV